MYFYLFKCIFSLFLVETRLLTAWFIYFRSVRSQPLTVNKITDVPCVWERLRLCTYSNCVLGCETESDKLKLLYLFSVNPDTHMGTHTHDLSLMTTSESQAKCRIDASFCCNGNVPMETGWAINQQNQTSQTLPKYNQFYKYISTYDSTPPCA